MILFLGMSAMKFPPSVKWTQSGVIYCELQPDSTDFTDEWCATWLLLTFLLGSLWIPNVAIQCKGIERNVNNCGMKKSCSITYKIDTLNGTEVMSGNITGEPNCESKVATGCEQKMQGASLEINCFCETDFCNVIGKWDEDVAKILQPYRQSFMINQKNLSSTSSPSTTEPSSTFFYNQSFAHSGTTLVFHTSAIPSSTMAETEDPLSDLFWTHCEVIAILLVFFGMASIGFVLLTLLFTFEWSWKERCCGKYRKKLDVEANLGEVVQRPVLKARRRLKKFTRPLRTRLQCRLPRKKNLP